MGSAGYTQQRDVGQLQAENGHLRDEVAELRRQLYGFRPGSHGHPAMDNSHRDWDVKHDQGFGVTYGQSSVSHAHSPQSRVGQHRARPSGEYIVSLRGLSWLTVGWDDHFFGCRIELWAVQLILLPFRPGSVQPANAKGHVSQSDHVFHDGESLHSDLARTNLIGPFPVFWIREPVVVPYRSSGTFPLS
jgi:hypothetical protein